MESTQDLLEKARLILQPLLDAEEQSLKLMQDIPSASLFVAIAGVDISIDIDRILADYLIIRKVTNPPGIVHIACAADLKYTDYLEISRYSNSIKAEFAIGYAANKESKKFLLDLAYHSAALLKIRGYSALFCPSASSSSWDVINAISDNSVHFHLLDDVPKQIILRSSKSMVTKTDIKWIKKHFMTGLELRDFNGSRRFGLAFNIAYAWNQTTDSRIALFNIWAGLEALFGNRDDKRITDTLAKRISDWIPQISPEKIRHLYNKRCDAVHGRWLNELEIGRAIKDSYDILRKVLIKCIETNSKTLPDWI